jgi:hypothetical protein
MNSSATSTENINANQIIKVIELRNYLIKPGKRDDFINYFETNFIQSQNQLGGHILGQYRIKNADDNFFWIRGFHDMPSRNKFLNDFYYSSFWIERRNIPNSMLLNNDNVYLLKPLNIIHSSDTSINSNWFGIDKGIAVVDFYASNTKLDKFIEFVQKKYSIVLKKTGIQNTSFWTSELSPNEFTVLPVFQNKDLMVQITFYKNELEYENKMKGVEAAMNDDLKLEMTDLITIKSKMIVYPTEKSFKIKGN